MMVVISIVNCMIHVVLGCSGC